MLRTALKPKWLMLLAVAILIGIAFIQLGRWQLGVAHDRARAEAIEAAGREPVVAMTSLLTPHTEFPAAASGRIVTVTGSYGPGQVLVANRYLNGRQGYWVITPLRLAADGATFPVLRGWVAEPTLPTPPTGEITVLASLAPGESPSEAIVPEGQLGSVDLAYLVNRWSGELYNAFGFAQSEQAQGGAIDPAPLTHVPPPRPDTGLNWRNAGYALQWWVFAAFALVMWAKMVQAEHRRPRLIPTDDRAQPAPEPGAAAPPSRSDEHTHHHA